MMVFITDILYQIRIRIKYQNCETQLEFHLSALAPSTCYFTSRLCRPKNSPCQVSVSGGSNLQSTEVTPTTRSIQSVTGHRVTYVLINVRWGLRTFQTLVFSPSFALVRPCQYLYVEHIFVFPLIFPTLKPEDIKQIKISLITDGPPICSHSLPLWSR